VWQSFFWKFPLSKTNRWFFVILPVGLLCWTWQAVKGLNALVSNMCTILVEQRRNLDRHTPWSDTLTIMVKIFNLVTSLRTIISFDVVCLCVFSWMYSESNTNIVLYYSSLVYISPYQLIKTETNPLKVKPRNSTHKSPLLQLMTLFWCTLNNMFAQHSKVNLILFQTNIYEFLGTSFNMNFLFFFCEILDWPKMT